MDCPKCGSQNTKVKPTRYIKDPDRTIRIEICESCGHEYCVEMRVMDENRWSCLDPNVKPNFERFMRE